MSDQFNQQGPDRPNDSTLDRWLTIDQAARLISHSKSWIYGRRRELPFVVKTPTGSLRVSAQKLKEWMAQSKPE